MRLVRFLFLYQLSQERGIEIAGRKIRVCENSLLQRDGSVDAFDYEHAEGPLHAPYCLGATAAMSNQLRD